MNLFKIVLFVSILKGLGYKNPVGLQCYNIKGEPEVFLPESVRTWEDYLNKLNQ